MSGTRPGRPPGASAAGKRGRAWRFGRWAERAAAGLLRLKGYRILGRGVRTPAGEIDIVARRGDTLAVIEVKARHDLATAAEALGPRQRDRIVRAAEWFRHAHPTCAGLNVRLDVILVRRWRPPVHLTDAWWPDG